MLEWIRRRIAEPGKAELNRKLQVVDAAAEGAGDSARAQLFNRGGDLCVAARQVRRALVYYGRAVDAYLKAGYTGPAAAMCRKILRHSPEAVRAHCTLACLAAHGRQFGEVEREVRSFVEASRRTRTERLTIPRLRLLAEAVKEPGVKRYLAAQLDALGDELGGRRVLASMDAAPHPDDEPPIGLAGPVEWDKLVRAAAADPDDLWRYA
ncbi:hypothetical protein [Longimicrobium sp.]|uniref:hypothetical protein n=1 Tax=Longimicrobium sp. TaxID=2029185 RepID=UPI002C4638AE|nr:hypothetical protein [Longimicrobium sp.]HSU17946.1 hypothetical protein [Longimicrobium sp.]